MYLPVSLEALVKVLVPSQGVPVSAWYVCVSLCLSLGFGVHPTRHMGIALPARLCSLFGALGTWAPRGCLGNSLSSILSLSPVLLYACNTLKTRDIWGVTFPFYGQRK